MKPIIRFFTWFMIILPVISACSAAAPTATQAPAVPPTETTAPTATRPPAAAPTETTAPTATATPEPSFTPTPALLELEILEWSEWPYANPADPANTDTHVEVLIRNPNDFPVRVNNDEDELRFINGAGEVVYTNPSSSFYIWQGEWMLPGETAALSACACFMTSGMEKQDWASLELVAPLEIATDLAYTHDVEVTLGEFFNLADAHLGGDALGAEISMTNTSDRPLESISMRVLAKDASGRHVGVAVSGNAVASFTENISIQPGETATGITPSEIDYIAMDVPLSYEIAAIGILARATPAAGDVLPSGTPLAEWEGIPVMPGAVSGEIADDGYQFITQAGMDEIIEFYETELANLGFEVEVAVDETAGYTLLSFQQGGAAGVVVIVPLGGLHGVHISLIN